MQSLTAEFIMTDNECLFNVNRHAQLGEISQRHRDANPVFSPNMLGYTVGH